jgi:hypothetical protein
MFEAYCGHGTECKFLDKVVVEFPSIFTIMVKLVGLHCHDCISNVARWLEGLIEVFIGYVESINLNKRWPKQQCNMVK